MRILIGGFSHETNTFSTVPTTLEDFHVREITRGENLLHEEAAKLLMKHNVEVIPTIYANAMPSGLVSRQAYQKIKEELLDGAKSAGKIDGVCLFLHGASQVEDIGQGEYDLVRSLREIVGEDVPISASLDLHGNISPELTKVTDILTAYRTAPHTDAVETKVRAASLLYQSVKQRIKPISVIVSPPILLPGEMVITDKEPTSHLIRRLSEIDKISKILNSSLLVGCAWSDTFWGGSSIIVVTEKDGKKAYEKAVELADEYWNRRRDFALEVKSGSIEETIEVAMASAKRPVFISDSGDNVTAGGAGDIPLFVEKLVKSHASDALVAGLTDSKAVKSCKEARIGSEIKIEVGGKLDTLNGCPLEVKGKVMKIVHDSVLFRIGEVDVILTAKRQAFTTMDSFKSIGVDPLSKKIVIVKLGYLYPELRKVAASTLMALSPGFTTLLINKLLYKKVRRPIFPLDQDFSWKAT